MNFFLPVTELPWLYDTTNSWKPLLSPSRNFLEVLEIPLSPGQPREPGKTLLDVTDVNNLNDELKKLPPQEKHTIRVYFSENLNVHGEETSITTPSSAGTPAMISQWGPSTKKIRWETNSYYLLLPVTSMRIPVMDTGETYIDSVSIAGGTIRRTLRCMVVSTEDGNTILYIDATSMVQDMDLLFDQIQLRTHDTRVPSPKEAFERHRNFCGNLRNSIEAYSILGAQVTPVSGSGLKQVLLLCYSYALVQEYTDSMYRLQANYARKKEGLSDPRGATLKISMLTEITRDLCFYEEVKDRASEVFGAVDALVDSLKILLVDSTNYRDFLCLAVELQSTCTDLTRTLATLSKTLDDHLRLFELSRGLHEAQNVRLLSILASIFLPLSLACGLLSMQTRFSNLSYLLYDFLGVIVLIGTIVAVFLLTLRSYTWWKGVLEPPKRNTMYTRNTGRFERFIMRCMFIIRCVFITVWAVLVSSFLVGMIKDIQLGLLIFGLGGILAVGVGGFSVLFGEFYISVLSPWAAAFFLLIFYWHS